MSHDDGELTITVGGETLGGWTEIEVIRGVEVVPWLFRIGSTTKASEDSPAVSFQPGDPCVIQIGGDTVLTGFLDRVSPAIRKAAHAIGLSGRSKSQDAVDCSAEWSGGQITGSSVLQIAQKLLSVYPGLTIEGEVDVGPVIPKFNLTIGESAYSIIERIARYRALLVYDLPNGNMVLNQAGSDLMSSGFTQGENILSAEAEYSMDQRFSDYEAFVTATNTLKFLGDQANLIGHRTDPNVLRHRLRTIILEDGALGYPIIGKRLDWENARRFGRSFAVTFTVDSWRDEAGKLWTPNSIVPIEAPALLLPPGQIWVISQVVFRRDNHTGTTAIVTCMVKGAFLPEPIVLLPVGLPIALALPPK